MIHAAYPVQARLNSTRLPAGRTVGCGALLVLAVFAAWLPAHAALAGDPETALLVSAENIVSGPGNWYLYVQISEKRYTFAAGDQLEYDIYLPASNPELKGGVDADFRRVNLTPAQSAHPWLRDCDIKDQDGLRLHGDAILTAARDRWYHRRFDLSSVAGVTAVRWNIQFEGDQRGRYIQLLANIRITHDGQTVFSVYENGPAPEPQLRQNDGYSRNVFITAMPRAGASDSANIAAMIVRAEQEAALREARDHFHAELEVTRALGQLIGADELPPAEIDAAAKLEDATAFQQTNTDAYLKSLAAARAHLAQYEPLLAAYTGHLVGHAHIDLQWLWSWDETVKQIIPDTFGQAIKFIKEFPDFTFSQSSAALYLATEQHHPQLFKEMQEYAKQGRWEPVGGRWCEADVNLISPESHVRQFLYAQRYFLEKFGRMCTDGWEPDTFGHPWTMPQILRQAGIRSYYFCRGWSDRPAHKGGPPLFWWEGPDGSRVLAFDESALESWYIGSVTDKKVELIPKFAAATGSKDYLMVYGVGNHGGGPTRENIEAALAMKGDEPWPTVKFSTLGEFYRRIYEQVDQLKLQTVRTELNPVFEGCYTSHSRIKRYNRDSESLLEGTEVFASLASLCGRPYPREALENLWRDVLWNHHHDTLGGSFNHRAAEYSAKIYEAVLKRGNEILQQSQQTLADHIQLAAHGPQIVVFNPLAWTRSEVVEATLAIPVTERLTTLYDADGDVPVQILDRHMDGDAVALKICFRARNVPGCGFKVFANRAAAAAQLTPVTEQTLDEVYPIPRGDDVRIGEVLVQPHFQILHEKPHGMSAWEIGEIDKTTEPPAEAVTVVESGPIRRRVRTTYHFDKSTITQDFIWYPDAGAERAEFDTTVEWNQVGNDKDGGDMLKVAFPTGIKADSATYEIPFGDIARPNDGHEDVALKWCYLTGTSGNPATQRGVTILNDCKHGYDVKDGMIRLTLLRSSYLPDLTPDVGMHRMRYAAIAHGAPLDKAAAVRAGWEFNKPLQVLVLSAPAGGQKSEAGTGPAGASGGIALLPATWSGCAVEPANVALTCLKRAEDGDGFIVRAYECAGQPAHATFALGFDARTAQPVDLIEHDVKDAAPLTVVNRKLAADFKPYEIRTFRVSMP